MWIVTYKKHIVNQEGTGNGMNELLDMFLTFARIGGLTFGGGYAMLPMLQKEVVEKKGWAENEELMDYYALGQCTPGIISVNVATFIGNKRRGVVGGVISTLGVVFPSVIIISIITAFISNFAELPVVQNAFGGIRVCVFILILNAVVKLWKGSVKDKLTFAIFVLVMLFSTVLSISPILYVISAGVIGVAAKAVLVNRTETGTDDEKGGAKA